MVAGAPPIAKQGTAGRSPRITITADDFGLAIPVNEAVEIAHRYGILGAASLMVSGEAMSDAVERARQLPDLRVGLHVVVVDGRPTLPPDTVPDLVDSRGHLPRNLVGAGLRFFCSPRARRQLRAEVRAQFEAFRATGLTMDHVDAHRHMHLHPTVLSAIIEAAGEYSVSMVRLPREPLRAVRGTTIGRQLRAIARRLLLAPWLVLMRWRLRRAGLRTNAYVLGVSDTGAMTEAAVLRLIKQLPAEPTEIYFHPATATPSNTPLPMPVDRHIAELAGLCSPRVRAALDRLGRRE